MYVCMYVRIIWMYMNAGVLHLSHQSWGLWAIRLISWGAHQTMCTASKCNFKFGLHAEFQSIRKLEVTCHVLLFFLRNSTLASKI